MFYSDCAQTVPFFFESDAHGHTSDIIWLAQYGFKTFRLKVTNQKAFSTKTNISRIEVSLLKLQFFKAGVYFRNFSTYREK